MANRIVRVAGMIAAAAVIAVAAASTASADEGMKAKVPFSFIAGKTTLPAGEYLVEWLTDSPSVVRIKNTTSGDVVYVLAGASESPNRVDPELVFDKIGTRYVLDKFSIDGSDIHEIPHAAATAERVIVRGN